MGISGIKNYVNVYNFLRGRAIFSHVSFILSYLSAVFHFFLESKEKVQYPAPF